MTLYVYNDSPVALQKYQSYSRAVSSRSKPRKSSDLSPSFYTKRQVANTSNPLATITAARFPCSEIPTTSQQSSLYQTPRYQGSEVSLANSTFSTSSYKTCYSPSYTPSRQGSQVSRTSSQTTVIHTPIAKPKTAQRQRRSSSIRRGSGASSSWWDATTMVEDRFSEDCMMPEHHTNTPKEEWSEHLEDIEKQNDISSALRAVSLARKAAAAAEHSARMLKARNEQLEQDFRLLFAQYTHALDELALEAAGGSEDRVKRLPSVAPTSARAMISQIEGRHRIRLPPAGRIPKSEKKRRIICGSDDDSSVGAVATPKRSAAKKKRAMERRMEELYTLPERIDGKRRPLMSKSRAYVPWGFSADELEAEAVRRQQVKREENDKKGIVSNESETGPWEYPLEKTCPVEFSQRRQRELKERENKERLLIQKKNCEKLQQQEQAVMQMVRKPSCISFLDMHSGPVVNGCGRPVKSSSNNGPGRCFWRQMRRAVVCVWPWRRQRRRRDLAVLRKTKKREKERRVSSFYLRSW